MRRYVPSAGAPVNQVGAARRPSSAKPATRAPRTPVKAPARLTVTSVSPTVAGGRYPAKRVVGDVVEVRCAVVVDGAMVLGAQVVHEDPAGAASVVPMARLDGPLFRAEIVVAEAGDHSFRIEAWVDDAATLVSRIERKRAVGQDTWNEEQELEQLPHPTSEHVASGPYRLVVDRPLAGFGAWYEFFPRSTVDGTARHATLRDAIDRLDRIAGMGFDIVYLPPIHPIGRSFRKGPNNATEAGPDDVGSPWAIGGDEGGHDAVHPALGTHDDLRALVEAAHERGLEVALDVAFQCSPDHPWVREHPEWFVIRPDGSIAYAENPPKRYQDIVPIDFGSSDWRGLWQALFGVFRFWRDHGVRCFRVDNPHTKSFPFWQWVIAATRAEDPGVIFLAEAFTHPETMLQLSRLGFTQSYTHFPWQHAPAELARYHAICSAGDEVEHFRSNAWPNTPDILTAEVQQGLRQVFVTRLVLAATTSANYGVYGPVYELQVAAARPGTEEYLDSEKYQLRSWDLDDPRSLAPLVGRVNTIRRTYAALQHDRTLAFHTCDNPRLVAFSKTAPARVDAAGLRRDPILVVANTDHWNPQEGLVHLDLTRLGLEPGAEYDVEDLLTGAVHRWQGPTNYVRLDPWSEHPVHVFAVRSPAPAVTA